MTNIGNNGDGLSNGVLLTYIVDSRTSFLPHHTTIATTTVIIIIIIKLTTAAFTYIDTTNQVQKAHDEMKEERESDAHSAINSCLMPINLLMMNFPLFHLLFAFRFRFFFLFANSICIPAFYSHSRTLKMPIFWIWHHKIYCSIMNKLLENMCMHCTYNQIYC